MAHDPLLDMTPSAEQMRLEGTFGMKTRPRGENVKRYREFGKEVAAGPLAVRAPLRAAPGILQTGDIRSQHETGESKGYLDPEYRARAERALGFDDHPVYGYIDPGADGGTEHYGELKFTMKDSVKDRTTILNGDSLTDPDIVGTPPRPVPVRQVQQGARLPKETDAWDGNDPHETKIHGYIEAQIHARPEDPVQPSRWTSIPFSTPHSRVPLSDVHSLDIDHNRLGSSRRSGVNPDLVNLGAQFQERGVSTWHTYKENDYQPPLPFGHEKLMTEHGFEEHHLGNIGDGSTYVRYPSGARGPENFLTRKRMKHQSQL